MYNLKDSPVKKIMYVFLNSNIGTKILHLVVKTGFEDFVFRVAYKDFLKNRQEFFLEHKNDIDENIELLEDEKSKEVYRKMIEFKSTRKRRIFPDYSINDQYFVKEYIEISPDEVFIDCGAYTGDTIANFKKYSDNEFKCAICFEPDIKNFIKLKEKFSQDSRIYFFQNAIDSECKEVSFNMGAGMESAISNEGASIIKAVNLDSIKECQNATFIKMDIEGAELNALKGAKNIISKNKPKLAISIYHSESDMIQIIKYIHDLVPEYKLYVRQHNIFETDTILYCII